MQAQLADNLMSLSAVEDQYPRIAQTLSELWGKSDCEPYLLSLVFDGRGGRQGFPNEVAEELMLLSSLMERAPGMYDIWFEMDRRT